jgi:hypothetical protein
MWFLVGGGQGDAGVERAGQRVEHHLFGDLGVASGGSTEAVATARQPG